MGKLIAIVGIAIVGFLAAVVGMLAATGNLNKDAVAKLLGREVEVVADAPPEVDPSTGLVKELKTERERLTQKLKELDERDEQLNLREQEVDATLAEIQALHELINANMEKLDAAQDENLVALSKTLASMKAQEAAISLSAMEPKDAVKLLPLIKDRDRGKIMDAMSGKGDKENRDEIFRLMQEKMY